MVMLCAFNIHLAAESFLQINSYTGAHSGKQDKVAWRWLKGWAALEMEEYGEAWLAI